MSKITWEDVSNFSEEYIYDLAQRLNQMTLSDISSGQFSHVLYSHEISDLRDKLIEFLKDKKVEVE